MSYDPNEISDEDDRNPAKTSQMQLDFQNVASTVSGRRVLKRILATAQPDQLSYTAGDPLATAFREGQRSVGLAIQTAITQAGYDFLKLIHEENIRDE